MDIQQAQKAAEAAIARLADAGHRLANEHAYALDQLRQENEALRRQNKALRERANGAGPNTQRFVLTLDQAIALVEDTSLGWNDKLPERVQAYLRGLKPVPDVQPVDTEAPVREVVIGAPRGSSMKFQMVASPHDPDTLASGHRSAVDWDGDDKWEPFDENGNYPHGMRDGYTISREEARKWVLDGVLP